jgi:S1-C subfamily serine protease
LGSGFVYDTSGYIITNNHVIDDAEKIVVSFPDERTFNAELIGSDPFTDIAVLKIDAGTYSLQPLTLGDSSKLRVGEQIAAIGNPFGLSGSMTSGIISQIGRVLPIQGSDFSIPDVIQTDAAINPGNSGGPLINMRGEVVGINTAIQSTTGEFAGVGFAIPSDTAKKIIPDLIDDGEYNHPWIGIAGRDIDPDFAEVLGLEEARGVFIESVIEESPASKAGLLEPTGTIKVDGRQYSINGDIILKVDDKEIRKIHEILIYLQREKVVGDQLDLGILRDGNMISITIILEERPN